MNIDLESWIDHSRNCLEAFERIKNREKYALKLLDRLIGKNDINQTEGIVSLCVALHDLGKLNADWQRGIGSTKEPLAHTPRRHGRQLPPHATVSAYSLSRLLRCLIGNHNYAAAFELAIGHHHYARAENVPNYILGGHELYSGLIKEISEKFNLSSDGKVEERIQIPTKLDVSFPDFERKKQYTVYCIVSRLIRLSDRESFELSKGAR